jgi:uncharacterized membrane protein YqjE
MPCCYWNQRYGGSLPPRGILYGQLDKSWFGSLLVAVAEGSYLIGRFMQETLLELGKLMVLIGLAVGFIFAGLVGLALLAGWAWDKLERMLNK